MFITTMPPTTSVIKVIGMTTSRDAAGELVDLVIQFLDIHQAEIVFFVAVQLVLDAHRHTRIFNRLLKGFARSALAVNPKPLRPKICR